MIEPNIEKTYTLEERVQGLEIALSLYIMRIESIENRLQCQHNKSEPRGMREYIEGVISWVKND